MLYTTSATVGLTCVIKAVDYLNSVQARYNAEVLNTTTGETSYYTASAITAATASVDGSVTFNTVSLPDNGVYMIKVTYANNDDADFNAVKMSTKGNGAICKVTNTATVALT